MENLKPKCEERVISVKSVDRQTNGDAREQLYAAAYSLFLLPEYDQVLAYMKGGPTPDLPRHLVNTSFSGFHVGRMVGLKRAPYVRIITNGGREVVVTEDTVTVNFRTAVREPSVSAAHDILMYLRQHTEGNVCWVEYEKEIPNYDKDVILKDGKIYAPDWDAYHQRKSS